MDSLKPDLEGTPCSITDCLRGADCVGQADVKLNPLVGATAEEERLVLDLPLCVPHAHLLRMGVTEFELESGLA